MSYFFNESVLIRAIRKLYGYSQEEFCILLGYSQSALSKIENGILSPDIKFVITLSQKINIDMNMFKYGHIAKIPDYLQVNKQVDFLHHKYLDDGIFSTKTAYLLLELIQKNLNINLFKTMTIPKEYFVFSQLKFNSRFFSDILEHVDLDEIVELIKNYKAQSHALLLEDSIKSCLLSLNLVEIQSIVRSGNVFEVGLSYSDPQLQSENTKVKNYFQHILAFNLLNELNVNVDLVKSKKVAKYDLVLRLHAS